MHIDHRVWGGAVGLLILTLILWVTVRPLGWVGLLLLGFHLCFFREPSVHLPAGSGPVSPAYGKITDIEVVHEDRFLGEEAYRIGIFLSIFDAHVTISPVDGKIAFLQYVPGKFLNALRQDSALKNESNWIGIESSGKKVIVRQITGAIARRIFWDVKMGDGVSRGKKIGVICYGSRVECYVPKRIFKPAVQVGDRVTGGQTLLGDWS